MHLAADPGTGEIGACVLTGNADNDAGRVPALPAAIAGEITLVTADSADGGEPVYRAIAGRKSDPSPDIVVPPRASAVLSTQDAEARSRRDRHIRIVAETGRTA